MSKEHHPKPIYLDNHSTTPVDPRVAEVMVYYLTTAFGNASSINHTYGDEAEKAVFDARQQIAQLINASPKAIIFTSGATESINLGIRGHLEAIASSRLPTLAVSPVEHKAVLDTCESLAKKGLVQLTYLRVDRQGRLDLEHLEQLCQTGLDLLCIMAANNEVGNIYPLATISEITQSYGVTWFCDASQAVGKIPINFQELGITYLALSAHKIYGPKGVGALVVKKGSILKPTCFGGGQQQGLRPGTLNVPGIVGLGEACRYRYLEMARDEIAIALLRDNLSQLLQTQIPDLVINGDLSQRLAGNLHIALPGIPNTAIIARVRQQLAISTGAACISGTYAISHVLQAMQLPNTIAEGSLRIGVGKFNTEAEITAAAEILTKAFKTSVLIASY